MPQHSAMPDIVVVTCWCRPELLAVTLEYIQRAAHAEEHLYTFRPDRGGTPEVLDVISSFRLPKVVTKVVHSYPGNTYNTLEGYRQVVGMAGQLRARLIYLIEEDVVIAPDFFDFHRRVQSEFGQEAFAVSACRNQNWKGHLHVPDPEAVYKFPRYQSLGVSFRPQVLRGVLAHAKPEYYSSMGDYLRRTFPNSKYELLFAEQDGLIERVMEACGGEVIYPYRPRAFHVGWYGYHRGLPGVPQMPLGMRIAYVRQTIQNPDALRALASGFDDVHAVVLDPRPAGKFKLVPP